MAYRPKIVKYLVIPNPDADPANTSSMATDVISAPSVIEGLSMMSYQVDWSDSTAVGVASVEVSNNFSLNPEGKIQNPGTWIVLPFNNDGTVVTSIPITGSSGTGGIDIDTIGFYAIRFVYTATSGNGTMAVIFNAKVA